MHISTIASRFSSSSACFGLINYLAVSINEAALESHRANIQSAFIN